MLSNKYILNFMGDVIKKNTAHLLLCTNQIKMIL